MREPQVQTGPVVANEIQLNAQSAPAEKLAELTKLGTQGSRSASIKFEEADLSQLLDAYGDLSGRTILQPTSLRRPKSR